MNNIQKQIMYDKLHITETDRLCDNRRLNERCDCLIHGYVIAFEYAQRILEKALDEIAYDLSTEGYEIQVAKNALEIWRGKYLEQARVKNG
jgi:hypothetical protein